MSSEDPSSDQLRVPLPNVGEASPTVEPPVVDQKPFFERVRPWLVFVVPFILYMAVENLAASFIDLKWPTWEEKRIDLYPAVYAVKLAITLGAVVFAWLSYPKVGRIHFLSVIVGVMGVVLWIGLAWAQRNSGFNDLLKYVWITERPSFNPWESRLVTSQNSIWNFIIIRLTGMAIIVPIVEEMFLRGFVIRFVIGEKWWEVPFGKMTRGSVIAVTAISMLMHPTEMLAALVWFGLIHWLYYTTKNIWDCIIAHGVTNLLLAIYIIKGEQWWLW